MYEARINGDSFQKTQSNFIDFSESYVKILLDLGTVGFCRICVAPLVMLYPTTPRHFLSSILEGLILNFMYYWVQEYAT
jgi:hypothetical protein